MALAYCEICGVLLQSPGSGSDPEGVICDPCFVSRQTLVSDSDSTAFLEDVPAPPEKLQFECVYCKSLLRVPAVAHRTNVKCPQCQEAFFLCPDGRVEARLEGNTTAILDKVDTLKQLSPMLQSGPTQRTQPMGRLNEKTQPISPVSDSQKTALRDLAAANLDVIQELPRRDLLPVDTRRKERIEDLKRDRQDAPTRDYEPVDLELLPEGMSPADVAKADTAELPPEVRKRLRASDEGRIDLDVAKLKQRSKTRNLGKGKTQKGKKLKADPQAAEDAKERREQRAAEAVLRAQELERGKARSAFRATILWLALLLPAGLTLLALSMTVRGAGFLLQGEPGARLQESGEHIERGIRAINGHLPEGSRLDLPGRTVPDEAEGS